MLGLQCTPVAPLLGYPGCSIYFGYSGAGGATGGGTRDNSDERVESCERARRPRRARRSRSRAGVGGGPCARAAPRRADAQSAGFGRDCARPLDLTGTRARETRDDQLELRGLARRLLELKTVVAERVIAVEASDRSWRLRLIQDRLNRWEAQDAPYIWGILARGGTAGGVVGRGPRWRRKRLANVSIGVPSLVARRFRTSNRDREIPVVVATILRLAETG